MERDRHANVELQDPKSHASSNRAHTKTVVLMLPGQLDLQAMSVAGRGSPGQVQGAWRLSQESRRSLIIKTADIQITKSSNTKQNLGNVTSLTTWPWDTRRTQFRVKVRIFGICRARRRPRGCQIQRPLSPTDRQGGCTG